ncbi:MAG: PAS domain S-box protein [Sphingomonas adhaesiva]|uniref:hybrid sensor histidine kinase/response regulator n=1 Tax=Sphingomonas adhaesiva TaxID=28212 RepID=UPI002FF9B862
MLSAPAPSDDLGFLAGGGKATALIRARDWAAHPLGPPATWPVPLKTALSLILNSPESMILCWGREEMFFFFNETYFPLLGPRLPWAMGTPMREVWADGWDQAWPIIEDAYAGRSQRFVDLPWKLATDRGAEDTWWSFSYSRILDDAGDIAGLFIFTNETTTRVLSDRALIDSQHQLRMLNDTLEQQVEQRTAERDRMWNTSPDLMVTLDLEGHYRRVNPAWATILGYDPAEMIGRHAFDLAHPDDMEATRAALGTVRAGTLPSFENRFRHKDGSYRWIQWVAAPGETEIFAIGRHVSAAKDAEARLREATEQLHQAQKMEAIGQLTGGVAHDFNNLLTIIRGSVELLRRPHLTEARRERYIDAIGETADRAARLTGQLLAFARRQALTPQRIDVAQEVTAVAGLIETLVGVHVAVRVGRPPHACVAEVDRSQLETAIVNLAINARDAIENGQGEGQGEIAILVGCADAIPAAHGRGHVAGRFVTIAVRDDGTGIDPDALPRIFEPFFTTKGVGKGTGLGLSQVIGFAQQSGGDVVVESVPECGTTFTLFLPRIDGAVESGDAAAMPEAAADTEGLRILLVEDHPDVGAFATEALAELGHSSVHVAAATEAIARIEAAPGRFDVVFSDVMMPGMNGVALAQVIAARFPQLPVVLSSGYSEVLADNAHHGFDLLQKPYSVEQLSRALRQAVAQRRG